jgi:hypothetical protein
MTSPVTETQTTTINWGCYYNVLSTEGCYAVREVPYLSKTYGHF